jgi:hypothetical protein
LRLALESSVGLSYQLLHGATCAECRAEGTWLLDLPPLAPGASQRISITAQLDSNLGNPADVVTTAKLLLGREVLDQAAVSQPVDGLAPTVQVNVPPDNVVGAGTQLVSGTADDADGSGIARVEVSDGGPWQTASGTSPWTAEVDVPPGDTFTLRLRATDAVGNARDIVHTFDVDATPPEVSFTVPPLLTGDLAALSGTTKDVGSRAVRVEVQLEEPDGLWRPAAGPFTPSEDGTQPWIFFWHLPAEDAVAHRLRARSSDVAGNLSRVTAWQATWVDNVAPVVTVTHVLSQVEWLDYWTGGVTGGPVISGAVTDGGGVAGVSIHVQAPTGAAYDHAADLEGDAWRYTPSFRWAGAHRLYVEARDPAGNVRSSGPYQLLVVAPDFPFHIRLPLVLRDYPPLADLQINSLTVDPASLDVGQPVTVEVTVENVGEAAAGPFWVDLYLNPDSPPTGPDQPWDALCSGPAEDCYGIAWHVEDGLQAGESLMISSLKIGSDDEARWPGYFTECGTHHLYAFVDSRGGAGSHGAVSEKQEGLENRRGPVSVVVAGGYRDILVNGDFESSQGWLLHNAAYHTATVYQGLRSLRTGVLPGEWPPWMVSPGQAGGYSSGRQVIHLPEASAIHLSYWSYPICEGNDLGDVHYVILQDGVGRNHWLRLDRRNTRTWERHDHDLSFFAGQTMTLYFGSYNDGDGYTTALFVDDVVLQVCDSSTPGDAHR